MFCPIVRSLELLHVATGKGPCKSVGFLSRLLHSGHLKMLQGRQNEKPGHMADLHEKTGRTT